ncbi:MalY/PatB family protein [Sunxiuqinia elliptica]|uniref:cysteine-S-conjugate beta-lyase n=1 Tax=Sunxiuqinia elliptica TaxID=655355 RepID=A0A1I2CVU4_9BACT|nr:PatB family C-S lyase [Sunxiuqinia elliptica]SFE72399.1 cystathione beta-lyase [Sunxiuqinia elliptica]
MKKYNFDELVDRTNTNCIKYDGRQMFFGTEDVLPLWVADMDFKTPDFIINALKERLEHEVLGYTFRDDSYAESITNWLEKRHAWKVEKEWLSFSPGVVAGLTLAIEAFSKPGDEVIVQPPVYFPFFDSVKGTGRKMVENPLKLENGRYTFDLEDLKQKITSETKLLLLCNPQNPGGMVWTREELEALTAICLENKVLIISDEIHSDLVFEGHKHIPLPTISEEVAQSCVVCMAGSKTFNIAGLTTSFVVIPNKRLLARYERELKVPHLHMGNIFGSVALETAYREGEAWLEQMLVYLQENMQLVRTYLKGNLPQVVPMEPEATYLVWLDFNALGLSDEELNERLLKAGVGLNRGVQFGKQGSGYMRINIGCQRSTLLQALERIKAAFA